MNKEELIAQGWDLTYSGLTGIYWWGKWMVHLHHSPSGHRVSGYGENETAALNDAAATLQKPLEVKNEIHH